MTFDLTICGVEAVPATIRAAKQPFTHAVSIGEPGRPVPAGLETIEAVLRLEFDDVEHATASVLAAGYMPPELEHVREVIDFGRRHVAAAAQARNVRLLVHCAAGISRSTASALIVCALVEPDPKKAVALMLGAQPRAYPNRRIVGLGDDELALGGALVRACNRCYEKKLIV